MALVWGLYVTDWHLELSNRYRDIGSRSRLLLEVTMPYEPRTLEQRAKIELGSKKARFDRIANPLWRAIHAGRTTEVEQLMRALAVVVERERRRCVTRNTAPE